MTSASSPGGPFVAVATDIGDRLAEAAIWSEGRCSWTGDQMELVEGAWQVVHVSLDASLYNGTSGIARFLAHLWRQSRSDRHRTTALGALRHAWRRAELLAAAPAVGLFNGLMGIACASVEVGEVFGDAGATTHGLELARSASETAIRPDVDPGFDIVDGLAGLIVALVHLGAGRPDRPFVDVAAAMGRQLVSAARRGPSGWSWGSIDHERPGLCGLAHGASGVALALMECHALTGDVTLRSAAREGLRYEKGWFSRRCSNWPDLRDLDAVADAASYPVYWCHGAAGIGLARLRLYRLTGDDTMLAEAGAALEAARMEWARVATSPQADPFGRNVSVCHGLGSLVELLTYAHQVLGQPACLGLARRIGAASAAHAVRHGGAWPCGVPGGGEHPGMMLGLAGVGLGYLRLADPRAAPSVSLTD